MGGNDFNGLKPIRTRTQKQTQRWWTVLWVFIIKSCWAWGWRVVMRVQVGGRPETSGWGRQINRWDDWEQADLGSREAGNRWLDWRIREQRRQQLLRAQGNSSIKKNSHEKQWAAEINHHCSWQNNLALTAGKTRVLIQALTSLQHAGEKQSQVSRRVKPCPKRIRHRHTEKGGDTGGTDRKRHNMDKTLESRPKSWARLEG